MPLQLASCLYRASTSPKCQCPSARMILMKLLTMTDWSDKPWWPYLSDFFCLGPPMPPDWHEKSCRMRRYYPPMGISTRPFPPWPKIRTRHGKVSTGLSCGLKTKNKIEREKFQASHRFPLQILPITFNTPSAWNSPISPVQNHLRLSMWMKSSFVFASCLK